MLVLRNLLRRLWCADDAHERQRMRHVSKLHGRHGVVVDGGAGVHKGRITANVVSCVDDGEV